MCLHNAKIKTLYFDSRQLSHARADDILEQFNLFFEVMLKSKLVQISRDGHNINWVFMKKLTNIIKTDSKATLPIDIGRCGLHTTHVVF